jgi:hypothetical protein
MRLSKGDYRKALESARAEFNHLMQKRLELDKRMVYLRQTIAGLMVLCERNTAQPPVSENGGVSFPPSMGVTGAARQILAESISPLSPPQLRHELTQRGLTRYADKLALIHNTLLRLERQGEAVKLTEGWIITDKGKLAVQMDALELPQSPG